MVKQDIALTSGYGQYHTNEADPAKPDKRLTPYVGLDWPSIQSLVDNPQQVDKAKAQWLIPSDMHSRSADVQLLLGNYYALWADFDTNPKPLSELAAFLDKYGFNYEAYTSKSATEARQKARLLIPIAPVDADTWIRCQRILNDLLAANGFIPDKAAERPAQLCYLPNRGEFYTTASKRDGYNFNPATKWADRIAKLADVEAQEQREEVERREEAKAKREERVASGAASPIDEFNSLYAVEDVLERAGYETTDGKNYRHPASESGNYSAGVKDYRVYALSPNDPLYLDNGGAHDAFSAFTVLFAEGDSSKAWKLAHNEWLSAPSYDFPTIEGAAPDADTDYDPNPIRINLSNLSSRVIEPPRFVLKPYIPEREVTSIYANGGTGKTLLSLNMAVCLAAGLPFLGFEAQDPIKVLFYSAEDDEEAVLFTIQQIVEKIGADPDLVEANLLALDATQANAMLFTERSDGGVKHGVVTKSFNWLRKQAKDFGARMVFVDNISDIYAGGESDRAQVRAFVRAMRLIAVDNNGGVMLVGHVDKATARGEGSTQSYSGSTAWNNSVRSRLFLSETEAGSLKLEHQKSNRIKRYHDVNFRFENLVPVDVANLSNPDPRLDRVTNVLRLIEQQQASGIRVTANIGTGANAFTAISKLPGFDLSIGKSEFKRIIHYAKGKGALLEHEEKRPRGGTFKFLGVASGWEGLLAYVSGFDAE